MHHDVCRVWFVVAELVDASQKEEDGNTLTGLPILGDLHCKKMRFFSLGYCPPPLFHGYLDTHS